MAKTFHEQELLDNIGDDVAFLAETVQMLETDGPALLKQIRDAVAAGDAPAERMAICRRCRRSQ